MSTDDRRDLHIHSYLRECAKVNLAQAEMDQGNGFYFCMSANVFSAFAIEAALNYIGHHIVSNWDVHERKGLPAEMKFIRKHLGLSANDNGKEPYQTFFNDLTYVRDTLAHGKPASLPIVPGTEHP